MKWTRRLYDWVLHWADTQYGGLALFLLAFAESSVFPIPPDVLLVALCIGDRLKSYRFAFMCVVGSLLGGAVGYVIGWGAWSAVGSFFFTYVPGVSEESFGLVRGLYERYDFWVVLVAAFTPIPYKVMTIAAGVFRINFPMFMLASLVGRSARFFLVAGLLHAFGESIRNFIDKRFDLLAIVFVMLLLGGFVVLKLVAH